MDRKTAYVEKLSTELVELDRQLDTLNYQADNAGEELKAGYRQRIDSLLQQRQIIELKLQNVAAGSDMSWQEITAGGDDSWAEIREDLHDTIVGIK